MSAERVSRRTQCAIFALTLNFGMTTNGGAAPGQPWEPTKTVEFIVGTAPGGSFDKTARLVQSIARDKGILKKPIIVVNKPGGAESIACTYLNDHLGDGHYLQVSSGNILSNHILGRNPISFADVTPVAMLFSEGTAIVVRADSPIKGAADLVATLRNDPQSLAFAVGSALGNVPHVAVSYMMKAAGGSVRSLKAVVFKSSGESVTAVLGGHIHVIAGAVSLVTPHVKAGKLRMIGVASETRLSGDVADVPTLKEQGVDAVVTNFRGFFGPKDLPAEEVAFWEKALYAVTQTPEWRFQKETNSWESSFMRRDEFGSFLKTEYAKTKTILSELGLAK